MQAYCCKSQLHQRSLIDLLDLVSRPGISWSFCLDSILKSSRWRGSCWSRRHSPILPNQRLCPAFSQQSFAARRQCPRSNCRHNVQQPNNKQVQIATNLMNKGTGTIGLRPEDRRLPHALASPPLRVTQTSKQTSKPTPNSGASLSDSWVGQPAVL